MKTRLTTRVPATARRESSRHEDRCPWGDPGGSDSHHYAPVAVPPDRVAVVSGGRQGTVTARTFEETP